jgi:tRNA threonylcarbamoyladenosine biosynthesis protein TsaB
VTETLLGFDTSTAATAVCVLRSDGQAFEHVPPPERLAEPPGHARELMPAIARALADAGVDWGDLDAVVVGVGPGTFTGLRIGVATARGLGQAHELPLRPVSSLRALGAAIEEPLALPVIDARRGELFAALYADGLEVWPPFVAPPERLAERIGAHGGRPLVAGDGSVRFRHVLEPAGARVAPEGSDLHVVRALHLCRVAADVADSPPEAVLPHYLRAPDARPR